jgi:hypothetical protein
MRARHLQLTALAGLAASLVAAPAAAEEDVLRLSWRAPARCPADGPSPFISAQPASSAASRNQAEGRPMRSFQHIACLLIVGESSDDPFRRRRTRRHRRSPRSRGDGWGTHRPPHPRSARGTPQLRRLFRRDVASLLRQKPTCSGVKRLAAGRGERMGGCPRHVADGRRHGGGERSPRIGVAPWVRHVDVGGATLAAGPTRTATVGEGRLPRDPDQSSGPCMTRRAS